MWTVALSQLRTQPRRYVSVVLAILIGTMFLAASFLVSSSAQATLRTTLGSTYAGADLVVLPADSAEGSPAPSEDAPTFRDLVGTPEAPGPLAALDGVAEAYAPSPQWAEVGRDGAGAEQRDGALVVVPQDPSLLGVRVTEGTLPAPGDPAALALDESTAERLGVHVGDTLTVTGDDGTGASARSVAARVTGLTTASPDPMLSSQAQLWSSRAVAEAVLPAIPGDLSTAVLLRLAPGVDRDAVAGRAAALLAERGTHAAVATPDEAVRGQLTDMTQGTDVLGAVLGAFAVLALLVTALVIANTFAVLVAQRTRDLALLRTVGASTGQVRGAVLLEALVAGLLGAVLGTALAVALTAGVVAAARPLLGLDSLTFGISWPPLALTVLVGTAVAVLAALVPARAATRVAPLQALRPAAETEVRSRAGLVRTVVGLVLAVGGAVLMWSGALGTDFVAGMGGGVLSFLGVLLLAQLFVPAVVRGAAVVARPAGVPGRLAGLNATRHRSRTAATAAALLIGTTLVALVLTGGRTAQHETDALLDSEFPVDLVVSVPDAGRVQAAADALAGLDDVRTAAAAAPVGSTANGTPVYAVEPDALRSVVDAAAEDVRGLGEDGTVYAPSWADPTVDVTVGGREQGLAAVPGSGLTTGVFVTPTTAQRIAAEGAPVDGADAGTGDPAGQPGLVLVSIAGDVPVSRLQALTEEVGRVAGDGASVVDGGAAGRAVYAQAIDAVLWIVVALLAVSVLIALIGVANTLSLSVIERTRENALLRALGLTRGGLRGMIAIEAVLIAAVAAALGCALGVFYGWAGSQLVLGGLVGAVQGGQVRIAPAVPWLELALIVAVAAVAGLLASLLPARRAARLSPVEGLVTV